MKNVSLAALSGIVLALLAGGCSMFGKTGVTEYKGLTIRENLLDRNAYNLEYKYGPPMPEVKYITIHNTWNFASAIDERDYLNNRRDRKYLSYHFAVDENGAVQILPLDIRGWHAGDGNGPGNRSSIGVEICRSRCVGKDEQLYRRAEENGVKLAAYLLDKFHLPLSALRKHQDWSGKHCPHRILDEHRWESFKQRVGEEM